MGSCPSGGDIRRHEGKYSFLTTRENGIATPVSDQLDERNLLMALKPALPFANSFIKVKEPYMDAVK